METAGKRQARIDIPSNLSESTRLNIAKTTWNLRYRLLLSWIEFNGAQQNLSILKQEARLPDKIVFMLTVRLKPA